ncbi:hypothetical protein SteCoe_6787 [Stentor coeruleus]|uniref:SAM domain-containing protein n=1 Tax=Stentor coeruleus TaxID=5963 RepID=A0A1R2CP64_9CILI|nr:hypothetical protein SteCoe_6787 [Stentor coeruleus]
MNEEQQQKCFKNAISDLENNSMTCTKGLSTQSFEESSKTHKNLNWSPLYRSVNSGNIQTARYLLSQGTDPDIMNIYGETALHQASDTGQYEIAELLLTHNANPNLQQKDGETPLHLCSFKGNNKMVVLLLKYGSDPNIQNFTNFRTPFHYAVDCNYIDCAIAMMAEGADPTIKDKEGLTVYDLAPNLEVEALLKNFVKRSSSISSFINPFNDLGGTGEGTTYLISDLGDDKGSITDTQYIKHSVKPSNIEIKEIYLWLESIKLEELYEILVDAGYDNSLAMTQQMKGPMPITEIDLQQIGIIKPGHRKRILWKLEEDHRDKHKRQKSSSILRCCGQIRDGTGAIVNIPTLLQMLKETNSEDYFDKFSQAGYENYEFILAQFSTKYGITKDILANEIGIRETRLCRKILNKISNDVLIYKPPEILYEEGKLSACELCIIV